MSTVVTAAKSPVHYPESDGLPMADNTKQFQWIVTIKGGLDAVFRHDANVFVAGNLLWYPVEGNNLIRAGPDVFVVFGRPKGHRGSYLQWLEGNIAPQVVFEILSPGNRVAEIVAKFKSYERYGVEEYYLYDPDDGKISGWLREDKDFPQIPEMNGWCSPRLGVWFKLVEGELTLYGPDGKKFATYAELAEERDKAEGESKAAQQRAERLAAQLKALGVEPEA